MRKTRIVKRTEENMGLKLKEQGNLRCSSGVVGGFSTANGLPIVATYKGRR